MTKTPDNGTLARSLAQPVDTAPVSAARCKPASRVLQDRQLEPARIRPNRNPSTGARKYQVPCLGLQSNLSGATSPASRPLPGDQTPRTARLQATRDRSVLQGRSQEVTA